MANQVASPGTIVNDDIYGLLEWTNPGNAAASDDVYATISASTSGQQSNYLKATNFGFTIPAGSIITGIKARVERHKTPTSGVTFNTVQLVKGGVVVGANQAGSTEFPTTDAYTTWGTGQTLLWGETWVVDDVNSANFGIVISVTVGTDIAGIEAYIDHIELTVYYTAAIDETAKAVTVVAVVAGTNTVDWVQTGLGVTVVTVLAETDDKAKDETGRLVTTSGVISETENIVFSEVTTLLIASAVINLKIFSGSFELIDAFSVGEFTRVY